MLLTLKCRNDGMVLSINTDEIESIVDSFENYDGDLVIESKIRTINRIYIVTKSVYDYDATGSFIFSDFNDLDALANLYGLIAVINAGGRALTCNSIRIIKERKND